MTALRILALAGLALTSCGDDSEAAPRPLRFTGIPDSDKQQLERQYAAVESYLEKQLDMPVEYLHVPDYAGAVTAFASNKVDLVWFGGVTAVEAEKAVDGEATFIAAREKDLLFKSYFIAHAPLVGSGEIPAEADDLSGLAAALSGHTFTFGSPSSTSGHIMPRYFMMEAGIDADEDLGGGGPKYSGNHDQTFTDVASGAVDMGALNYTHWEGKAAAERARAPVVYTTPDYVDYCWVASDRLGEQTLAKLRAAFVSLSAEDPADAAVLETLDAERFVPADSEDWDQIRQVLEAIDLPGKK